jgi:hypothetical protein
MVLYSHQDQGSQKTQKTDEQETPPRQTVFGSGLIIGAFIHRRHTHPDTCRKTPRPKYLFQVNK